MLNAISDLAKFRDLAAHGRKNNTQMWLQLGHAGALAYTMRLTDIRADKESDEVGGLGQAIRNYAARDDVQTEIWLRHFES